MNPLFALPVLLPVLDLAPWTGWFFIEEMDLLLLLTAAFLLVLPLVKKFNTVRVRMIEQDG